MSFRAQLGMDISKNKIVQNIIDTHEMVPYFILYLIALNYLTHYVVNCHV